METSETGFSELRSDGAQREDECAFLGEFPEVRSVTRIYSTHGGYLTGATSACGKCGCEFINVVCPQRWPINTVALACAKCGSIVEYIDGLMLMEVKQAIREFQRSSEMVSCRPQYDNQRGMSGIGVAKELVQMGIDGGLTDQDIAEAMEVSEDYVALIAATLR
jgi:hypothetical protein